MNNAELKKKISVLYDMELNNYLMNEMISRLEDRIDSLGKKRNIAAPQKAGKDSDLLIGSMGTGALIFAIIGAVWGLIYNFVFEEGFFSKVLGFFFYPFTCGAAGVFIGGVLGLIVGLILLHFDKKEIEKAYKKECFEHSEALKKDSLRVEHEKREKEILIQQRDLLIKRKSEATIKLKSFYSLSGIDSHYRNLVPIGYMNEFIRLGISNHLEGADGLYYLVRKELRADRFQCSLDEISYKLDDIIDRQREIYGELRNINQRCDYLIDQTNKSARLAAQNNSLLNDAVAQTRITAYNTERIAKETEFQNYMLICK